MMLIVSNKLLARTHEHGSWQHEGERNLESHVLVTEDRLRTVAQSVFTTALQLDLHKLLDMKEILKALQHWAVVSSDEENVWKEKGSNNAPIFEKSLWDIRKKAKRPAEVQNL